uniref:LAM_G_DOMAIN domain-containing protein n=1 Tax=Rhabditophanes sp. KR3021 TaxID=114890 RepID=A0AC35U6G0_9BILA
MRIFTLHKLLLTIIVLSFVASSNQSVIYRYPVIFEGKLQTVISRQPRTLNESGKKRVSNNKRYLFGRAEDMDDVDILVNYMDSIKRPSEASLLTPKKSESLAALKNPSSSPSCQPCGCSVLKVFSALSNVTALDTINVDSVDSKIEITENGNRIIAISSQSSLSFPADCKSFNLSLQNQLTQLNVSNLGLSVSSALANLSEIIKSVGSIEETELQANFDKSVLLKVNDGQTNFRAINGTSANLHIITRPPTTTSGPTSADQTLSLRANHSNIDNQKILYIESESNLYEILASIMGADIVISFDKLMVLLYNNYNRLTMYSMAYVFDFDTDLSHFDMRLSKDMFIMNAGGNAAIISYDLKNRTIHLVIQQPNDAIITMNGAKLEGNGSQIGGDFGKQFTITSNGLQIVASDTDKNFFLNSNQSVIKFGCEKSMVTLTSQHHTFKTTSGQPNITITLKPIKMTITIYPREGTKVPEWAIALPSNDSQIELPIGTINTSNWDINNVNIQPENSTMLPPINNNTTFNPLISTTQDIASTTSSGSGNNTIISSTSMPPLESTSPGFGTQTTTTPSSQTTTTNKGIITTTSTTFNDSEFPVAQYNTETSRSSEIIISATVSGIVFENATVPTTISNIQTTTPNVKTTTLNDETTTSNFETTATGNSTTYRLRPLKRSTTPFLTSSSTIQGNVETTTVPISTTNSLETTSLTSSTAETFIETLMTTEVVPIDFPTPAPFNDGTTTIGAFRAIRDAVILPKKKTNSVTTKYSVPNGLYPSQVMKLGNHLLAMIHAREVDLHLTRPTKIDKCADVGDYNDSQSESEDEEDVPNCIAHNAESRSLIDIWQPTFNTVCANSYVTPNKMYHSRNLPS